MPYDDVALRAYFTEVIALLSEAIPRNGGKVHFEPGLSDEELAQAEVQYHVQFPADWRLFLQLALPVGMTHPRDGFFRPFPIWRTHNRSYQERVRARLKRVWAGVRYDIAYNDYWPADWGERPERCKDQLRVARRAFADYPPLVPIYQHRYLAAAPLTAGNPVFSVSQTDVIYYGYDLPGYFNQEFDLPLPDWAALRPRCIPYWSDLAGGGCDAD